MALHVVVGKGAIGRTLARHLHAHGHDVLVLSRSGGRPDTPAPADDGITWEAADAADGAALASASQGAQALYNCVNPPYHRWPTEWPPVADAFLTAAERTGAVLVTAGNLYGYGAGTEQMTETSLLRSTEAKGRVRAAMWQEASRRHHAGALRATEVRGSDYLGPGAQQSHAGPRMLEPLLAGRTVRPPRAAPPPPTTNTKNYFWDRFLGIPLITMKPPMYDVPRKNGRDPLHLALFTGVVLNPLYNYPQGQHGPKGGKH